MYVFISSGFSRFIGDVRCLVNFSILFASLLIRFLFFFSFFSFDYIDKSPTIQFLFLSKPTRANKNYSHSQHIVYSRFILNVHHLKPLSNDFHIQRSFACMCYFDTLFPYHTKSAWLFLLTLDDAHQMYTLIIVVLHFTLFDSSTLIVFTHYSKLLFTEFWWEFGVCVFVHVCMCVWVPTNPTNHYLFISHSIRILVPADRSIQIVELLLCANLSIQMSS